MVCATYAQCLSVYMSMHMPVHMSIHMSVHTSMHLSIHMSVHKSVQMCVHFMHMSVHKSAQMCVRLAVHMSIHMSVHTSGYSHMVYYRKQHGYGRYYGCFTRCREHFLNHDAFVTIESSIIQYRDQLRAVGLVSHV